VEDPSFRKADDVPAEPIAAAGETRESTAAFDAGTTEHAIQPGPRPAPPLEIKCPHCGGVDLVRGVTLSQPAEAGSVGLQYRTLLVLVATETLYADLCKACGSVARLYVRETDRNWVLG
jgi:hypothetical protein